MRFFGKKRKQADSSEWKDAVLTLYACRKDGEAVPETASRLFSEMMDQIFYTDENEFLIRFKDGSSIKFHVTANTDKNKAQAEGMARFFAQSPLGNEEVKRAAFVLHPDMYLYRADGNQEWDEVVATT